ncbi:MAG: dual specificity protein phosphatase family protein [Planctomycetes bacterium]|nr:dual specificity protein phosphatase family protein [Planctomycetota bacterium]
MKLTRRTVLLLLLFAGVTAWVLLHRLERSYQTDNYTLIEDGLYIGGLIEKPPPNVTAVLNLCRVEDRYQVEHALWLPIKDASPAPSLEWLKSAVDFVDTQRQEGRTVFVHCRMGVSRSGLVVVAFLMRKNGWTHEEALAFARTKRPEIRPNEAFTELLLKWELFLK